MPRKLAEFILGYSKMSCFVISLVQFLFVILYKLDYGQLNKG